MLKGEREQEIMNIMKEAGGYVTVKSLCDALYASESSIRRDLASMEKKGVIKRSYGGAELITNFSHITAFNQRYNQNASAKREIAEKAAALIEEDDIVFLDQSSTAFCLASLLPNKSSLTVITNNVEIMHLLSDSNISVISSGGHLSRENRCCLLGRDAEYIFEHTHADIAFFSCKSLSDDGVISDFSREEVVTRRAIIENAEKKVFLCDSKKFGTQAAYKQCSLDSIDYLVSDGKTAHIFKDKFPKLKTL